MKNNKLKYMEPWDPKSPEEWAAELQIEPLEPLTVTRRAYDTELSDGLRFHTVETRWKGLHRIKSIRAGMILADESAIMDSGPKMGATPCITDHIDREITDEERARNWDHLQDVCNQAMRRMGIW